MKELDMVVLTRSIDDLGLHEGDLGTIVHCYPGGEAFEVEFSTADGATIAVLTLPAHEIRRQRANEILHVRVTARAT